MRTPRTPPSPPPGFRRVLPVLIGWLSISAVVAVAGRIAARRRNEGDQSTAGIRRVVTLGGLELRPVHPHLARVRLDLAMAGAELDLTAVPRVPGGVDVTVHALMAGLAVRVPADWRVWWSCSGLVGVGAGPGVQRTSDEAGADLRLHVRAVAAGIGVERG